MFLIKARPARHESGSAKILKRLKKASHYGLTNYELSRTCLCWHRRITELRKEGHRISTVRVKQNIFKYYYQGDE